MNYMQDVIMHYLLFTTFFIKIAFNKKDFNCNQVIEDFTRYEQEFCWNNLSINASGLGPSYFLLNSCMWRKRDKFCTQYLIQDSSPFTPLSKSLYFPSLFVPVIQFGIGKIFNDQLNFFFQV